MRQEWIIRTDKTELQDLHTRQIEVVTQIGNILRNHSQIFSNDRQRFTFPATQRGIDCRKKILTRTRNPTAGFSSQAAEGDFIVASKATEVIETNDVHKA